MNDDRKEEIIGKSIKLFFNVGSRPTYSEVKIPYKLHPHSDCHKQEERMKEFNF